METGQEQIYTSLKPIWKTVSYLCAGFIAFVSLDIIMDVLFASGVFIDAVDDVAWPLYFFTVVFLASIASIIYISKYRLSISDDGIKKEGAFFTYTIPFDEIDKIVFDSMLIIFHGNDKSVSLGNLYNDYERAAQFIFKRLEGRDDLTIKGKQKHIDKFLGESRLAEIV